MRTHRCIRGLILAGLATLLLSATVRADDAAPATQPADAPATRPAHGGPFVRLQKNLDQLGLTDQQKSQIDPLIAQAKQQVQDAITQANGDRSAARDQIRAIMKDLRSQLNAILTADQQAQLKQLTPHGNHATGGSDAPPPPPPGN